MWRPEAGGGEVACKPVEAKLEGGRGGGKKPGKLERRRRRRGAKKSGWGAKTSYIYCMYINARKNKEISEIKIITVYNHCYSSFDM